MKLSDLKGTYQAASERDMLMIEAVGAMLYAEAMANDGEFVHGVMKFASAMGSFLHNCHLPEDHLNVISDAVVKNIRMGYDCCKKEKPN